MKKNKKNNTEGEPNDSIEHEILDLSHFSYLQYFNKYNPNIIVDAYFVQKDIPIKTNDTYFIIERNKVIVKNIDDNGMYLIYSKKIFKNIFKYLNNKERITLNEV